MEHSKQEQADIWRPIAARIREALPQIDALLSAKDVPIAKRRSYALTFIETQLIETNVDSGMLIVTEAYARIVALVDEWYRERYGSADRSSRDAFASVIFLFDTPFAFEVPLIFTKPGEEKGSAWFGLPASVQPEENPVEWIVNGPNITSLLDCERARITKSATELANSIRAINFDLRTVESASRHELAELARMIVADLQSAATALKSSEPGLRASSGWALSQATEKALKLYIRVRGGIPKNIHVLSDLADHVEAIGSHRVDRTALARIPSGSHAVDLRDGGAFSWKQGEAAYAAAVKVIERLAAEVEVKTKYNVRNARFLLKPPWFSFDTDAFIKSLKTEA